VNEFYEARAKGNGIFGAVSRLLFYILYLAWVVPLLGIGTTVCFAPFAVAQFALFDYAKKHYENSAGEFVVFLGLSVLMVVSLVIAGLIWSYSVRALLRLRNRRGWAMKRYFRGCRRCVDTWLPQINDTLDSKETIHSVLVGTEAPAIPAAFGWLLLVLCVFPAVGVFEAALLASGEGLILLLGKIVFLFAIAIQLFSPRVHWTVAFYVLACLWVLGVVNFINPTLLTGRALVFDVLALILCFLVLRRARRDGRRLLSPRFIVITNQARLLLECDKTAVLRARPIASGGSAGVKESCDGYELELPLKGQGQGSILLGTFAEVDKLAREMGEDACKGLEGPFSRAAFWPAEIPALRLAVIVGSFFFVFFIALHGEP